MPSTASDHACWLGVKEALEFAPAPALLACEDRVVAANEAFRKLGVTDASLQKCLSNLLKSEEKVRLITELSRSEELASLRLEAYVKGRKKTWSISVVPQRCGDSRASLLWFVDSGQAASAAAYWDVHTRMNSAVAQAKSEKQQREVQAEEARRARLLAEAAHRDVQVILDASQQGFVTVDLQGRVVGQWSQRAELWLPGIATGLALRELVARIDPTVASWMDLGFSELRDGCLGPDIALAQLPERLNQGETCFGLEYRPVREDGVITKVVVVVSDRTAAEAAKRLENQQREIIEAFRYAVKDRDGFMDFVRETERLVSAISRGGGSGEDRLRWLHTIKGNTAIMAFMSLSQLCHEIESEAAEEDGRLTEAQSERLARAWHDFKGRAVTPFLETQKDEVHVDAEEYSQFMRQLAAGVPRPTLVSELKRWTRQSVDERFHWLGARAKTLAKRMGKGELEVEAFSNGVRVDSRHWAPFWSALVHVLRNALSHGFESPDERAVLGKGAPRLRFTADQDEERIVICVGDDGRGIDWEKVRDKAREHGRPHATQAQLCESLFAAGMSTADDVDEVSGRGLGLSAVLEAVNGLGGRIAVWSERGQGTQFSFVFPRSPNSIREVVRISSRPGAGGELGRAPVSVRGQGFESPQRS